jgi:hypothetical protein
VAVVSAYVWSRADKPVVPKSLVMDVYAFVPAEVGTDKHRGQVYFAAVAPHGDNCGFDVVSGIVEAGRHRWDEQRV